MSELDTYEVFAIQYCYRPERKYHENYISNASSDPLHDTQMPLAYYVWLLRNTDRTIVVDTGFDRSEGKRRQAESGGVWRAEFACEPYEGLAMLGVDATKVQDVIITHLHYDHAGTLERFPAARFHLQDLEMQFATGRHMADGFFSGVYTLDHVLSMVRHVYHGRVAFHDGDAQIAPGISVHHIGGHTMGMQCVRVATRRGAVVLASDASHFYGNFEQRRPFPIVYNAAEMYRGFDRMQELASSRDHVVPGHDPLVMTRYPSTSDETSGLIVRLDVEPGR